MFLFFLSGQLVESQLVVRNVGGGRPGEIDRASLGQPGKYTFCFAEAEHPAWEPLAVQQGLPPGKSAVTVYGAAGVQGLMDQKSRTPESLARNLALSMRVIDNAKFSCKADALLVLAPEHAGIFIDAGWSKGRLIRELEALLVIPAEELVEGALGIEEGMPASQIGSSAPKFRPGGIHVTRAGGDAGPFTAIVPSWPATGARGTIPVTKEIHS